MSLSQCERTTLLLNAWACAFYWRSIGDAVQVTEANREVKSLLKGDRGNARMAGWWLLSHLAAEVLWALMHINEIGYVIPDSRSGSNTNEP